MNKKLQNHTTLPNALGQLKCTKVPLLTLPPESSPVKIIMASFPSGPEQKPPTQENTNVADAHNIIVSPAARLLKRK